MPFRHEASLLPIVLPSLHAYLVHVQQLVGNLGMDRIIGSNMVSPSALLLSSSPPLLLSFVLLYSPMYLCTCTVLRTALVVSMHAAEICVAYACRVYWNLPDTPYAPQLQTTAGRCLSTSTGCITHSVACPAITRHEPPARMTATAHLARHTPTPSAMHARNCSKPQASPTHLLLLAPAVVLKSRSAGSCPVRPGRLRRHMITEI